MWPFNDCQLPVALPHLGPSIAVPSCLLPHCLVSTGFTASKPSDITSFIFPPLFSSWLNINGRGYVGSLIQETSLLSSLLLLLCLGQPWWNSCSGTFTEWMLEAFLFSFSHNWQWEVVFVSPFLYLSQQHVGLDQQLANYIYLVNRVWPTIYSYE